LAEIAIKNNNFMGSASKNITNISSSVNLTDIHEELTQLNYQLNHDRNEEICHSEAKRLYTDRLFEICSAMGGLIPVMPGIHKDLRDISGFSK